MKLAAPVRHGCTLARLARPFWATSSCSPVREHRDSIPEGAGPAGQPSHIFHRRCACPAPPLQWDGGDGGTMANDDTASKRRAEEIIARYTINLRRALSDLVPALKHAYGQPALDAADTLSPHVLALTAIARFLDQLGPDYLAHEADQVAKLAQMLRDVNEGVRAPPLYPARAKRSDQTLAWLARAHVALAVETMRRCGHSRESATKWVAKRHPELEQLITESAVHRSSYLETAIISWCEDFSSLKIRIGIGGSLAAPPLPHHRAYGSVHGGSRSG